MQTLNNTAHITVMGANEQAWTFLVAVPAAKSIQSVPDSLIVIEAYGPCGWKKVEGKPDVPRFGFRILKGETLLYENAAQFLTPEDAEQVGVGFYQKIKQLALPSG